VAFVKLSANALFFIIHKLLYKSVLICVCGNSYTILEIGFVRSLIFTGYHLFFILWFFNVFILFKNICSSMNMFHHIASLVTLILYKFNNNCSVLCQSSTILHRLVHRQSCVSYAKPYTATGIILLVSGTSYISSMWSANISTKYNLFSLLSSSYI